MPPGSKESWEENDFNPWTNDRVIVNAQLLQDMAYVISIGNSRDPEGLRQQDAISAGMERMNNSHKANQQDNTNYEKDLDTVFSLARHGRHAELDDFFEKYNEKVLKILSQQGDAVASTQKFIHIDSINSQGNTILIISCQNNQKRILKMCLRRGADINAQNSHGNTGLHYAFSYQFTGIFEYLLKSGADDTILNKEGLTCYEGLKLEDLV